MNVSNKKIAGVILAAGSSSRMGKTKQLLPFNGKTILGHVIQNARDSALHEIIVVLGHCADEIKQTLDLSDIKVVKNNEYEKGQSTSLIKGLKNISPYCDAAMFLLGDQPLVIANIINLLINIFQTPQARSKKPIIIPSYNGKRGNPVIINRSLFQRLKLLSGDIGAKVIFDEYKESILEVPVPDEAVLIDVDTMDDYKKLIVL